MKTIFLRILLAQLFVVMAQAAVIYEQPPATLALGFGFASAFHPTAPPYYQNRCRDSFRLATAATIREIRWRGTFSDSEPVGFTVRIFDRVPTGIPETTLPPLVTYSITGTAGQTPAGTFNGAPMFDYRYVLPTPFAALGNNKVYWVEIAARQLGVPDWSWAIAAGGDGGHFVLLNGPFTDSGYYGSGPGDGVFSLYDAVENPPVRIDAAAGPGGGGTVTGGGTYPGGASVTVTAAAAAGYKFTNWKEGQVIVSTNASYTFTPAAYRDLKAHFTGGPPRSTITTGALPETGCITQGGGSFAAGDVVELSADPKEYFAFQGWFENDAQVSSSLNYTFTANGTRDRHFVARSTTVGAGGGGSQYSTLRLISQPSGAGTVTGGGAYMGYVTRAAVATPPPGRTFLYWTNGGSIVSYNTTYVEPFAIYNILYAFFSEEIIVTPTASPTEGGTVTGGGSFPNTGGAVNLVATPAPGYAFVSWTRGTATVTTNPALSFPALAFNAVAGGYNGYNDNPVANFVALRTITTSTVPPGAGTVTGGGAMNDGSTATVTATANVGYAFSEWTVDGVQVSTSASYSFPVLADTTVVANFTTVPTCNITTSAAPAATGTTSGGGVVNQGSSVTVVATPGAGYAFANWTESGVQVSTAASYTFVAAANRTLVANFIPLPTYTVTANVTPAAGGTATGGGPHMSGTTATLTATPNPGYVFWKWTVGGNLVSVAPTYSFTVTANRTVVANFAAIGVSRTITTSANPTAGGTVSGGGTYVSGNSATVLATPNAGYIFTRWQESGVDVSTSASYTFSVAGNRTLTARFSPGFIITATAAPAAGGTAQMSAAGYVTGTTATATATPAADWIFDSWTENGTTVSTSATYTFTVNAARTLVANFYSDIYAAIETTATPAIGGTAAGTGIYLLGNNVTVTATPNPGYAFHTWSIFGTAVSWDRAYTFIADDSYALTADFVKVPAFTIAPAPGGALLAWPANATGWVLQESNNLIDWWDSALVPTLTGTGNAVPIGTTEERFFFRLVYP